MPLFFYLTTFNRLERNHCKYFVGFLGDLKMPIENFEIKWLSDSITEVSQFQVTLMNQNRKKYKSR